MFRCFDTFLVNKWTVSVSALPCKPRKFWNFSRSFITDYLNTIGLSKDSQPLITENNPSAACGCCPVEMLSQHVGFLHSFVVNATGITALGKADFSGQMSIYPLEKIWRWIQRNGQFRSEKQTKNTQKKTLMLCKKKNSSLRSFHEGFGSSLLLGIIG